MVPEDWKEANVIPTFKKGKEDLGDYLLVILILIPTKMAERKVDKLKYGQYKWTVRQTENWLN